MKKWVNLVYIPVNKIVRNTIIISSDPAKCVRTDVTLAKEEFFDFNVALSTQVTFCLKELRAILFFAEPLGLDIQCRMEGAGQ